MLNCLNQLTRILMQEWELPQRLKLDFLLIYRILFSYPQPQGLFLLLSLGWAERNASEKLKDYWVSSSNIPLKTAFPPLSLSAVILAPRDCSDYNVLEVRKNGVYRVTPDPRNGTFEVFCDMESFGGGWTVIQQRLDGSVSFNRTWTEYKKGFGNLR